MAATWIPLSREQAVWAPLVFSKILFLLLQIIVAWLESLFVPQERPGERNGQDNIVPAKT